MCYSKVFQIVTSWVPALLMANPIHEIQIPQLGRVADVLVDYNVSIYDKSAPEKSEQDVSALACFKSIDQAIIDEIYDILEAFDVVCTRHKLDYMIACGTQLGATRHGGFIPWDIDGDVIILSEDEKVLLSFADEWKSLGYELKLAFMHMPRPTYGCIQLYKIGGLEDAKIDILSVELEGEDLVYSHEGVRQFFPHEKLKFSSWKKVQEFEQRVPFGHLMLKGLKGKEAVDYLTTLYGSEWNKVAANMWLDFSQNLLLSQTAKIPLTQALRKPALRTRLKS